jgi:hypothetical protein
VGRFQWLGGPAHGRHFEDTLLQMLAETSSLWRRIVPFGQQDWVSGLPVPRG